MLNTEANEHSLFDIFNFESTDLFEDAEEREEQVEETNKKRAKNGRKEYTNMRHVWTNEEIKLLVTAYVKKRGHVDDALLAELMKDMRKGITSSHINKYFKTLRAQQRKDFKMERTHRRDARYTKAK